LKQVKLATTGSYSEYNQLTKRVNAHFDYLMLSKCKHQGEYYIKATVPKKGINYIPRYPLILPDKLKDYAHLKKLCGNKKMVIIMSGPMASWTSNEENHAYRLTHKGFGYDLLCGKVAIKIKRCQRHYGCWKDIKYNNSFDDFKVFYIPTKYAAAPAQDHTKEWQLEMSKIFLAGF
jgi:hypothetical protein